jgi:hypothetical protein
MTATGPVRVLVVDDQELVRTGFCVILEGDDGITVVAEAANGAAGGVIALTGVGLSRSTSRSRRGSAEPTSMILPDRASDDGGKDRRGSSAAGPYDHDLS